MNKDTMTTTDSNKCCIIIPTYNNSGTLEAVIRGVLSISKILLLSMMAPPMKLLIY